MVSTHGRDIAGPVPCTHEEADTKMPLHVEDAMKQGYTKVSIGTVDTDVVVHAVATAERLNIDELWGCFRYREELSVLSISHEMAQALGPV